MDLYIVDSLMLVHRAASCSRAGLRRKVPITRNVAMVHRKRMPACPECWPDPREYDALIIGSDATWSTKIKVAR